MQEDPLSLKSSFVQGAVTFQFKTVLNMAKILSSLSASSVAALPSGSAGGTPTFVTLAINGSVVETM